MCMGVWGFFVSSLSILKFQNNLIQLNARVCVSSLYVVVTTNQCFAAKQTSVSPVNIVHFHICVVLSLECIWFHSPQQHEPRATKFKIKAKKLPTTQSAHKKYFGAKIIMSHIREKRRRNSKCAHHTYIHTRLFY